MASQSLPGDPPAQKEFSWKGIVITWVRNSTHLGYGGCLGCFLFASRSILCPSLLGGPLYKKRELSLSPSLSLVSQFGNRLCSFSMDTASPGQPLPTPLLSCPDGRRQPVPSRRAALHSRNSGRVSGAQGTAGAFLWWPLMLASGETSCKLSPEESDPRVLTCNWNLGPRHTLALSWINSP